MAVLRSLVTTLGLNSAQFRSELQRAQRSYSAFGSALATGTRAAGKAIGTLTGAVTSVNSALVALGAGAAIYGIKQAYVHADEIRRQGEMVGVAAGKWSAYEKAAQMVGISSENLSDVFKDLNVRITDAAKTGSGSMVDFFNQINQDAREWVALSPDQQFRRFTVELNKMSQSDARFWLDEVNDSAVQMFETLVKNDGEFLKLADNADKLGLSLTSGQFKMIGGARRELEALAVTGTSVWQQVLVASAPAVTAVSKGIRQWITDQATAAGGFRQLGVVIAETVLTSIVDVARTLENVLNSTYKSAEELAAMMGKTLNPQRASIERQLDSIQSKMAALNTELVKGVGDAPDIWSVPDESIESYQLLQDEYNSLRQKLTKPFSFADSLEGQVSGIVSTIKAAQVDIQSNAPVDAFGAVNLGSFATATGKKTIGGSKENDDSDLSDRLAALRESYSSETDLLRSKIASERDLLRSSLEQGLIDKQEYNELKLAADQEYSDQFNEIERNRIEQSGSLLEQLRQNIESTTLSFSETWSNAFDGFSLGFSDSVANSIVEGESFGKAMENVGKTMAKAMISSLVQIGVQRMALWATEKMLGATMGSALTTSVAGEAAAGVQLAGINAFASTAAIPVVGPAAAPAAAAAAIAATTPMAIAATAAAAGTISGARALGGEVKAGSTYLVGERGAELFVPGADGQITSHDKLAAAARGSAKSNGISSVTLAPSIVVESGASQSNDEFFAENVAAQVFKMVLNDANSNGILSRALGRR